MGEAVRQRRAIMVNDFASTNPLKKGYPSGYVRIVRFMTVPIFKKNSIVGVIGLTNKATDYLDADILQIALLMEAVWKFMKKQIAAGRPSQTVSTDMQRFAPSFQEREERARFRILLAEDNITNQKVALGILDKIGFRADIAANGEEAITLLETLPYDLILMDVHMPEMDGFTATRLIRSGKTRAAHRDLPIIALTAQAMKSDRESCIEAGMSDYLTKPIEPRALAETLERWLIARDRPVSSVTPFPEERYSGGPPPVFDCQALKNRLDKKLAEEIITIFLDDMPEQLAILKELIAQSRTEEAGNQAHKIKGAAFTVCGMAMGEAALAMELAGKSGKKEDLMILYSELNHQFELLCNAMREEKSAG